jgi:hypothetical protein
VFRDSTENKTLLRTLLLYETSLFFNGKESVKELLDAM